MVSRRRLLGTVDTPTKTGAGTGDMATAYHLEALRKQRSLDRARKAREQIETEVFCHHDDTVVL